MVNESRRRLYLIELQLRQYEVGRSILVSQLAEAENVERQYEIARDFDPFNAVADWQKAEGMVLEKSLNARAIERVYTDTKDLALGSQPAQVDPAVIEEQLARLRSNVSADAVGPPPAHEDHDQRDDRALERSTETERARAVGNTKGVGSRCRDSGLPGSTRVADTDSRPLPTHTTKPVETSP